MKKALLYSIIACFFLFSCKKEKNAPAKNTLSLKKYSVNFSISDFTQLTGGSVKTVNDLKTDAISSSVSVLYYYVYDSSGNYVHTLSQLSTNSNFGTIQDSLATGTYTVAIAAGQTGLSTGAAAESDVLSNAFLTYDTYVGENGTNPYANQPWKDTFLKKFSLTVGTGNINQTVALDRIVGKIEVQLQDTIPPNAYSIQLTYTNEYSIYSISSEQAISSPTLALQYPLVVGTVIPVAAKGTINYTLSNIIGNTAAPIDVTIKCFDASKNVIAQATVPGVNCQKDVITVLSGKLFIVNNSFQVSVNPTWDTPIIITY